MKNAVITPPLAVALLLLIACGGQREAPAGATPAENAPAEDTPAEDTPAEDTPAESAREKAGGQYGETAGGAVTVLRSEEESGGHFASMADMLRGRVAGLQVMERPNGDISLRIRGLSKSFVGNEEPLLVVDGLPMPTFSMSNTLRSIDPSDVESIQVLKDVGSTSAYGVRGANGVIVIRLKRR